MGRGPRKFSKRYCYTWKNTRGHYGNVSNIKNSVRSFFRIGATIDVQRLHHFEFLRRKSKHLFHYCQSVAGSQTKGNERRQQQRSENDERCVFKLSSSRRQYVPCLCQKKYL